MSIVFSFPVGAVIGAVVPVVSFGAYKFVARQIASVKAKAVAEAKAAEAAAKAEVAKVAADVAKV